MRTERFANMNCSIARTAAVVADPWALLVLRDVFLGIHTFDELHRDLGVATNVLVDRLDRLVREGVIERRAYLEHPPRYSYELTEAGAELGGVVLALMAWGDKHRAPEGVPLTLEHAQCGAIATPTVTCDQCGEPLTLDAMRALPGPGGRAAPGTALLAGVLTGGQRSDR